MKPEKIKRLSEVENKIKQLKNATFSLFKPLFEKIVKSFTETDVQSFSKI